MHSIKKYVNKGERKDSAMPTLDKAKAWAGEGHNKERERKKGHSVGLVVFYPGRRYRLLAGHFALGPASTFGLAASAFSCFIRLSFPWKQVKLCRQTRARCRLY